MKLKPGDLIEVDSLRRRTDVYTRTDHPDNRLAVKVVVVGHLRTGDLAMVVAAGTSFSSYGEVTHECYVLTSSGLLGWVYDHYVKKVVGGLRR